MNPTDAPPWIGDWAWSLPLIVLTVLIHVSGLALIGERIVSVLSESMGGRRFMAKFAIIMGGASLLATLLHGIEAVIWAAVYRFLGALPDYRSAILYSLSSMTTYGHANLFLKAHWQLMGAFEALTGLLVFGITTAFLFAIYQRVWPLDRTELHR